MICVENNHKSLGLIGILCGFLCEAAAALPFVAPEVIWVTVEQSLGLHLAAALLTGGGAAALFTAGRGSSQWVGPTLFFAVIAFVLPGAGLFTVLLLTVILISHHAQEPSQKIGLAAVSSRRPVSRTGHSLFGPGPAPQPLVGSLHQFTPADLQRIVLGLEAMPPAQTRPILQKLQRHPDVRVQLYANGLLNDQLDVLERRLATLKQRVVDHPGDQASQTAVIETYLGLFENRLIAPDEEAQIAAQALRETETALAFDPSNATALQAHVEFQILRGEFRSAAIGIEQLRQVPGQTKRAAGLQARLLFDLAAVADVPHPSAPTPVTDSQSRSAQN